MRSIPLAASRRSSWRSTNRACDEDELGIVGWEPRRRAPGASDWKYDGVGVDRESRSAIPRRGLGSVGRKLGTADLKRGREPANRFLFRPSGVPLPSMSLCMPASVNVAESRWHLGAALAKTVVKTAPVPSHNPKIEKQPQSEMREKSPMPGHRAVTDHAVLEASWCPALERESGCRE